VKIVANGSLLKHRGRNTAAIDVGKVFEVPKNILPDMENRYRTILF
jgi:hypothetical protein